MKITTTSTSCSNRPVNLLAKLTPPPPNQVIQLLSANLGVKNLNIKGHGTSLGLPMLWDQFTVSRLTESTLLGQLVQI